MICLLSIPPLPNQPTKGASVMNRRAGFKCAYSIAPRIVE
jgi:hypothetical protein